MKYFEGFPKIKYPYQGKMVKTADGTVSEIDTVDLTIRFKVIDNLLNNPAAYDYYSWQDKDRPDVVAHNVYGNADLAWVVMLSASIFDWGYDVPMPEDVFVKYLICKYDMTIEEMASTIHHYETSRGYVVDSLTYSTLVDDGKSAISIYDYESSVNESRRIVKLIHSRYIGTLTSEFATKLKSIKSNRILTGNL